MVFGNSGFTLIPGARYDRYQMDAMPDPTLDGTGQVSGYGFPRRIHRRRRGFSQSRRPCTTSTKPGRCSAQYAEGYRPAELRRSESVIRESRLSIRHGAQSGTVEAENSKGLELGLRANLAERFPERRRFTAIVTTNFIETSLCRSPGARSACSRTATSTKSKISGAEFNAQFFAQRTMAGAHRACVRPGRQPECIDTA